MITRTQPLSGFLLALLGPMVWAMHFFVVYGLEAALCTRAISPVLTMRWTVAVATAGAVGGLVVFLILRFRRSSEPDAPGFLRTISISLALISVGAILAVAASALRLPACLQPAG
jgi:hypothetical protein